MRNSGPGSNKWLRVIGKHDTQISLPFIFLFNFYFIKVFFSKIVYPGYQRRPKPCFGFITNPAFMQDFKEVQSTINPLTNPAYVYSESNMKCIYKFSSLTKGYLISKINYNTVPVLPNLNPFLIFPFNLLPSPLHPTGFFFYFFPGFPAIYIFLSLNKYVYYAYLLYSLHANCWEVETRSLGFNSRDSEKSWDFPVWFSNNKNMYFIDF